MSARQEASQPFTERVLLFRSVGIGDRAPLDQHRAQIFAAAFGNAEKAGLAAGCDNTATFLAKINAENRNLHGFSPSDVSRRYYNVAT
jgi:hypothetical protein